VVFVVMGSIEQSLQANRYKRLIFNLKIYRQKYRQKHDANPFIESRNYLKPDISNAHHAVMLCQYEPVLALKFQ
jgi:hypothetical protein